jgi:hypothetical protein
VQNERVRELLNEKVIAPNKGLKRESVLREFGAANCLSLHTIRRAERSRAVEGGKILCLAMGLGCSFLELAEFPSERAEKPGPKTKRRIPKTLRIMFSRWPRLADDHTKGLVPELVGSAIQVTGRKVEAASTEDTYALDMFTRIDPPFDALVCTGDHRLAREKLQLVLHLVRMPIGLLTAKGVKAEEIADNLFQPRRLAGMNARPVVFFRGFSYYYLQEHGCHADKMQLVKWPDGRGRMHGHLTSGRAQFAIANWHTLHEMKQHDPDLELWRSPVAYCDYSVWVKKGDYALANWLRTRLILEETSERWRGPLNDFNNANRGCLEMVGYTDADGAGQGRS